LQNFRRKVDPIFFQRSHFIGTGYIFLNLPDQNCREQFRNWVRPNKKSKSVKSGLAIYKKIKKIILHRSPGAAKKLRYLYKFYSALLDFFAGK